MRVFALCLLLLISTITAQAATWFLEADGSGDAPHILAAIDSAAPGDTILLNDGIFSGVGNQYFIVTKTLTFRSVNGPEFTRIFLFNTPGFEIYAPNCVIEGIAIDRAAGGLIGGGILVGAADFTVRECWFVDCIANGGAGIAFWGASGFGRILDCEFRYCVAGLLGGAVVAFSGMDEVLIEGCLITACNSPVATQSGSLVVRSTTFWGNEDGGGGGSAVSFGGSLAMENCVIANSTSTTHPPLFSGASLPLSISCTNIFGNTQNGSNADWVDEAAPFANSNDNFSGDPLFCGPSHGDFSLSSSSPCAPGNHPTGAGCGLIGAFDVGCGGTTRTEGASWSDVKEMFR